MTESKPSRPWPAVHHVDEAEIIARIERNIALLPPKDRAVVLRVADLVFYALLQRGAANTTTGAKH